MKVSDQEKQEILHYLEIGKPLPDKYRFLLFDEKREVELVWNGKTSEVSNIVLPFQTIEHVSEPFSERMKLFAPNHSPIKGWTNNCPKNPWR